MTFLNPFLLFGLAAAAIPLIIHLLNIRKFKVVEFSSIQFLKELQKTKMRRVKIRQILLLILRTLLIILIVLAFARPALRGSVGTTGTHAKSTIVILLDDSPSMTVRDERGMLFNQATAAVSQLLSLVKEGDELYFVRLSEVRHNTVFPATSISSVNAILNTLVPALETGPFRDAFGVAARLLAESKNFNQEVYLISDAQATQFATAVGDSTDLFADNVKMFLIETGKQQNNAGVVSLDLKTQIITKDKPVKLSAMVHNIGNTPMHNSLMSVYVDGSRVVQQSLDIGTESSATIDFAVTPKRRGMIQGYVQLEDDALEADNKRFFVINVPENISILMIGGKPQDTKLASLALTLGGDSSLTGLFTTRQVTQAQLSSLDINKFDALVFCGVKEFTPTEADRIAQFVRAGGGVIIFPDDETNVANWNETIFAKLNIPAGQSAQVGPPVNEQSSFLSFDKLDYDHPLFQGIFEQPSGKKLPAAIESPRVYKSIRLQAGVRGHTIISLSDGSGFLTEFLTGSGHVLLFSVEANTGWSDFPVKGLFAPLLHRSILYLARGQQDATSTIVGETIKVQVRRRTRGNNETYAFRSPGGIDERTIPHTNAATGVFVFESSATTDIGVYELLGANEILAASAINVAPAESDLRHATEQELAAFWKQIGVHDAQTRHLRVSDKLETTVLESRLGVELWMYLLVLAVIVALTEMALAREPRSAANAGAGP